MNVADADEISTLKAQISSYEVKILVIEGEISVTKGKILVIENTRKQRIKNNRSSLPSTTKKLPSSTT
jgi:hypothetical protein